MEEPRPAASLKRWERRWFWALQKSAFGKRGYFHFGCREGMGDGGVMAVIGGATEIARYCCWNLISAHHYMVVTIYMVIWCFSYHISDLRLVTP